MAHLTSQRRGAVFPVPPKRRELITVNNPNDYLRNCLIKWYQWSFPYGCSKQQRCMGDRSVLSPSLSPTLSSPKTNSDGCDVVECTGKCKLLITFQALDQIVVCMCVRRLPLQLVHTKYGEQFRHIALYLFLLCHLYFCIVFIIYTSSIFLDVHICGHFVSCKMIHQNLRK